MNRTTTASIVLPFGPKPGWELEGAENDKEGKRSISESCVLIQALRQSRDKWLYSTFPRFSSKVRGGKTTEPAPPPHTIQTRGKCDLEIGPHIFSDTTFYEVHYLPSQPSSTAGLISQTPKAQTALSQPRTIPENGVKNPEIGRSSGTLASNFTSVATITPALINQVNSAASSNPTLANLLQLAAAGLATPDQLKTLGLLIQSLANSEAVQPVPASLAATPLSQLPAVTPSSIITPPVVPVKEFDLVLEFRENPNERWVFPRGLVTCERITNLPAVQALCRAVIRTCLPFPKPAESETSSVSGQTGPLVGPAIVEPQVATFILERTPLAIWDTISRWAGNEEKFQQNKMKLDAIVEQSSSDF
ncbi:hypothetical protein C0992_010519 [Termitomyces sp. T32_za158]|nr:hypothetical protein C0992_010519 [Termitomyces sp. T32_za158]